MKDMVMEYSKKKSKKAYSMMPKKRKKMVDMVGEAMKKGK